MTLTIKKIPTSPTSELTRFIDFQYHLYQDDPSFRPELKKELWDFFTNNPFLQIAEVSFYLAMKQDEIVGRIAKIKLPDNPIMFGFFDCINDSSVAKALFDEIDEQIGLLGPVNFTTNDSCGILIEGFTIPSFMMPYNKPYYQQLFEKNGFKKKIDLFAYLVERDRIPEQFSKKCFEIQAKLKLGGISIRQIDFNNFKEEVKNIVETYNQANQDNWGYLPLSLEEGQYMGYRLKKVTKPPYVLIAEKDGDAIGYLLSLPDINEIIFKKGKLSLKTIWKAIFYKPSKIKILILGIKKNIDNWVLLLV